MTSAPVQAAGQGQKAFVAAVQSSTISLEPDCAQGASFGLNMGHMHTSRDGAYVVDINNSVAFRIFMPQSLCSLGSFSLQTTHTLTANLMHSASPSSHCACDHVLCMSANTRVRVLCTLHQYKQTYSRITQQYLPALLFHK